jgi:hypothetical protein
MVYALKKCHHYLLGSTLKLITDHFSLKYLTKKLALGSQIYRWFLFFQEFHFEIVLNPKKHNVGPDNLSHIQTGEHVMNLDDELPDAHLFQIEYVPNQLVEIVELHTTFQAPSNYTPVQ